MARPRSSRPASKGDDLAPRVCSRLLRGGKPHLLEGGATHLALLLLAPAAKLTPIFVLLAVGVTGVTSYDLASFFSRKFVALGITGVDIHKLERPIIPEMGGLSILLAMALGSTILVALNGDRSFLFLAGVSTVLLTGLIG